MKAARDPSDGRQRILRYCPNSGTSGLRARPRGNAPKTRCEAAGHGSKSCTGSASKCAAPWVRARKNQAGDSTFQEEAGQCKIRTSLAPQLSRQNLRLPRIVMVMLITGQVQRLHNAVRSIHCSALRQRATMHAGMKRKAERQTIGSGLQCRSAPEVAVRRVAHEARNVMLSGPPGHLEGSVKCLI